ncbi:unnamed protein product [Lymnaea stagnalis]|uniref:xanthine dehydrogenase n=1 Tax=Lymnaea stagnalis TaxID=6523 RepID=A0AAV2HLT5_LYMST
MGAIDLESLPLIFYVNGLRVEDKEPDPEMTLLTYIRTKLHLTGSKLGCGEGGCGACTVMVSKYSPQSDTIKHYNVNACLAPVCSMHGLAVTTVEGIGNVANLHPVQERIAKFHGSQCGFCTPGIVMTMYTLLRNNVRPTARELEEYFDGNLCRCTGYRAILDGFWTFTKEFTCAMGSECCQNKTKPHDETNGDWRHTNGNSGQNNCSNGDVINATSNGGQHEDRVDNSISRLEILGPKISKLITYQPSQEPIFPPDLKVNHDKYHGQAIKFQNSTTTWMQPVTLNHLLELKAKYQTAKLVVGNTEIGVETKFKSMKYPVLIATNQVKELLILKTEDSGLVVGASVSLSQLDQKLRQLIKMEPEYKTRVFSAIVEMLRWFASHQIRNVASVAGNIMTASPISDLNPLLLASEARVTVQSKERGQRVLKMDKDFFTGYRKTAVDDDEVLVSITIPFTKKGQYFNGFKQALRKDDDISLVNAGMMVSLSVDNTIIGMSLAFGGMGLTTVLARHTVEAVLGSVWNDTLLQKVFDLLPSDLPLSPGAPGGSVEYRRTLAASFFFKFYLAVKQQACGDEIIKSHDLSALKQLESSVTRASQIIGAVDSRDQLFETIGKPTAHISALQQSTGEAIYIDDMIPIEGELHLALVTSTKTFAKIVSIDPSAALAAPGVVDFVSAADIPGKNHLGIVMDKIFEDCEVTCQGQIIGAIVADTHSHAHSAVKLVKVKYEEKSPVIITIKDAIKHQSFFSPSKKLEIGDLTRGFNSSDHILEGEVRINGQNHFYLETMASRILPGENGEMEVFASTQNPTELQFEIAEALGVEANKIKIRIKRIGGGFGGKESQTSLSALPTAIAARKLGKPVRCILERDEDMVTTGNRHPFMAKYKVGFKSNGKVLALDMELFNNAGNSIDLSIAVMEKAMLEIDSCYYFANMRLVGKCCKTNIMSNTAFRGFGGVQAHFIVESIMDDIVFYLKMDPIQVREINFFQPDDLTHFAIPAGGESLKRCWDMCIEKSAYHNRRKHVDEYNRCNRWKKKGIAVCPVKFGISFIQTHMNQAGALVHIYKDGSVLVTHAGVEMGQGLHIKISQIASEVLGLPLSRIHISETSTSTVPNTMPTAASVGTDLNGMAVKNACEILKERLKPFVNANPKGSWEEWITSAYMARVSLSSTGFYKTPDVGYDMDKQIGRPFAYFTFGAACTEVQIDCLTGEHKVLQTDIVMDVGNSINPAIDVGQIEGAFTQGYGLMLTEDIKVSPEGSHITKGPGNYKIPSFGNIPAVFNVYLVPDSSNPKAIFSSRAVGEPPLLLAISAFFAVKDAIRAARIDNGESVQFELNSPALPANIRMACNDTLSRQFPEADPESYHPWTVDL